ncbi:unnamed protein product [Cylicostephanus goldi]|uniref:AAA+ ATPase domain-containing protein n=1 Tax=Cylicostephanus goldi TaxID=71465 RepID=A0A3P6QG50_CYLGO|nr:unnamed protein product [Cylicostephanus goldi]
MGPVYSTLCIHVSTSSNFFTIEDQSESFVIKRQHKFLEVCKALGVRVACHPALGYMVHGDQFSSIRSTIQDLLHLNALVMVKASGMFKNVPTAIVGVLPDTIDSSALGHKLDKPPKETFEDIGGLEGPIQEMKESVELPLTHPEYYEEMGITAPKGVILYGPPGTGKTLLAKAVANSTAATFIRATGADLVQKNSGDGAKLVRELFKMARDNAPSIVFLDEIDAVGTKRYDTSSRGEQEVQRTLLELLNQLDGFESRGDVKVILATNRIDVLDSALLRPGRIDRKIELPKPDDKTRQRIFSIHTSGMNLAKDVTFDLVMSKEKEMSGAEIKAVCTEAGMLALRAQRKVVCADDFEKAIKNVMLKLKGGLRLMIK